MDKELKATLELDGIRHGVLFLTFDDHDIVGWTRAIPLFRQNNVHATFSFSGEIGPEAISCMRELQAEGHTIGLHTVHHANAPEYIEEHGAKAYLKDEVKPQLDACKKGGIACTTFAFPNNKYNDEALALLSPKFHRFRAGCRRPKELSIASFDGAFCPVAELKGKSLFGGFGVGEYYNSSLEEIEKVLERISRNNEAVTIFSHGIASCAKGVNMPLELLMPILSHAVSLGIVMAGLEEVP